MGKLKTKRGVAKRFKITKKKKVKYLNEKLIFKMRPLLFLLLKK